MFATFKVTTLLAVLFSLLCLSPAQAAPLPADIEGKRALNISEEEERHAIMAVGGLTSEYEVAISYESAMPSDPNPEKRISYRIRRNETLGMALSMFKGGTNGMLEAKRIRNVLCVVYNTPPGVVNPLDCKVSLKLENVTAWEAFKTLGKTINTLPQFAKRPAALVKTTVPIGFGKDRAVPPVLYKEKCITLNLTDVTAREAACAIVEAAPFEMKFQYIHGDENPNSGHYQDTLYIQVLQNGKPVSTEPLTKEEEEFWRAEIKDGLARP